MAVSKLCCGAQALERTISEDDDAAADALASIVEVCCVPRLPHCRSRPEVPCVGQVAVQTPKLLQGSLDETVRCMLTIAKHSDLSDRYVDQHRWLTRFWWHVVHALGAGFVNVLSTSLSLWPRRRVLWLGDRSCCFSRQSHFHFP